MNDLTAETLEYAGFWVRLGAFLIDGILLFCITGPLLMVFYGANYFDFTDQTRPFIRGAAEVLISWIFPVSAVIWFWIKKQATPGKMLFSLKVVNANTGMTLTLKESIIRYAGYLLSSLLLCLGYLWIAFDSKKQGWHDKIAGTVVVRSKQRGTEAVRFPQG